MEWIRDNILLIMLSLGTAFTFFWLYRHRGRLGLNLVTAPVLAAVHTLTGLLMVKIFAVLETLDFEKAGSMSLFGAIFFLPLFYWCGAKLFRRNIASVFDIFTPCMVFTLLCARINCLFSGCCLGQLLPGGSDLRWPTREAEILFYVIVMAYFWYQDRKKTTPGWHYPFYMVAYGAFRFLTEGFRQSDSSAVIHISHIWAAVTFCLGLSIYMEMKNKQSRRKTRA